MEVRNQKLLSQRGQTVVEYILLLAVSASLIVTFYRSSAFQRFFGSQGQLGKVHKLESEWGYRHALASGRVPETNQPKASASEHPSYYNASKNASRFFGASDAYK